MGHWRSKRTRRARLRHRQIDRAPEYLRTMEEGRVGWEGIFSVVGLAFILIGIALILLPVIGRLVPTIDLERIPWLLLYVYKRDRFVFVTSPLLILVSIISLLWSILTRSS